MTLRDWYLWIVLAGMLPEHALAEVAEEKSALFPASPLGAGALTETALGLLAIVALIFALSWFFRRFGRQALLGKGVVNVMGGVSLGPRERAVLLQVDGIRLLVGVAPGQVRLLHVLGEERTQAVTGEGFEGELQRALGGER
ncbi:MAG: flagellar biosynthetic protein FliO [Gammaproteobacteria bacterium]|nr:flagellar biosynthetic protein FliO [Gammaproteobacteria bacterium]